MKPGAVQTPTSNTETTGHSTIYVSNKPPTDAPETNWLPVPPDEFSLYIRA